jgi:hypothetical protein
MNRFSEDTTLCWCKWGSGNHTFGERFMNIDSEEITPYQSATVDAAQARRFVPLQVGSATVYVEQVSTPAEIEGTGDIYPVAPSPQDAFQKAGEVLEECVRMMGERIEKLAEHAKPQQITVEFTLTFEATGRATLIPVLITAESKAGMGFKVTALWGHPDAS